MSHLSLSDPSVRDGLLAADQALADAARAEGCPTCGGPLHAANYWRRPRGGPFAREIRFSFCCAVDGCRRRRTPPSWRFLGRKVYLGAVVVLSAAWSWRHLQAAGMAVVEVPERTRTRWRHWWREAVAGSRCWQVLRGRFATPVDPARLPASLLERFAGDAWAQVVAAWPLLLPITGGEGLAVRPR